MKITRRTSRSVKDLVDNYTINVSRDDDGATTAIVMGHQRHERFRVTLTKGEVRKLILAIPAMNIIDAFGGDGVAARAWIDKLDEILAFNEAPSPSDSRKD